MSFSDALIFVYRAGWRFLHAGWWLVGLLVLLELVLLLLDISVVSAFRSVWISQLSEIVWHAADACLALVIFYVVTRFLAFEGDMGTVLQANRASMRTFLPFAGAYLAFEILIALAIIQSGVQALMIVSGGFWLLFALWAVSAPGGGKIIGPLRSARHMLYEIPWAFALVVVAGLPFAPFFFFLDPGQSPLQTNVASYWMHSAGSVIVNCIAAVFHAAAIFVIARDAGLRVSRQQGRAG